MYTFICFNILRFIKLYFIWSSVIESPLHAILQKRNKKETDLVKLLCKFKKVSFPLIWLETRAYDDRNLWTRNNIFGL